METCSQTWPTPLPGRDQLPHLLLALALLGLGNACTFVACSVAATHDVEPGELGLASGMLYTAQQVGSALGISILVGLAATRTSALQSVGQVLGYLVPALAAQASAGTTSPWRWVACR